MRSNMHSSPDMLIKHTFPVCENGVGVRGGPCEDTAVKCLECQSEWAWRWHFHFTRQAQNWNIQISQNEKRWHTRKIPNKMSTCKEKKIRGLLAITSDFYIICKVLPPACPTQSPECLGHLPPKMSHHKACGQISLGLVSSLRSSLTSRKSPHSQATLSEYIHWCICWWLQHAANEELEMTISPICQQIIIRENCCSIDL